jgi:hypothetical protein
MAVVVFLELPMRSMLYHLDRGSRMKFWQLVSIFRDDLPSLRNILREPARAHYLKWLGQFDELVRTQNREILDHTMPRDLILQAMQASKLTFSVQNGYLRLGSAGTAINCSLSAMDVYTTYGPYAIEDVLEYGVWHASS